MNNNEKAAKFIAWVQKKKGFKTQDEAINYVKGLDEKGKESLAQQYAQANAQRAAHGAKLNYVNNLKHKCADDEELVYFKVGGKVGCGCVKKQSGGGDISPEERKRIDAKAKAAREAEKNVGEGKGSNKTNRFTAAKIYKDRNTKMNYKNNPDEKEPPRINKGLHKNANGAKLCGGSKLKLKKKGGEVCPKCGKVHSAGIGCSVAAFKEKFEKGGSLNGIPFYQEGTNEGGILSRIFKNMPHKPISGSEAYISDTMVNDKDFKKYNNKANAYSEATPNIQNTVNSIINRLKASYYGNKTGLQGYFNEKDKYSRDQWNRGNYLNAVFGSPFVPVVNR